MLIQGGVVTSGLHRIVLTEPPLPYSPRLFHKDFYLHKARETQRDKQYCFGGQQSLLCQLKHDVVKDDKDIKQFSFHSPLWLGFCLRLIPHTILIKLKGFNVLSNSTDHRSSKQANILCSCAKSCPFYFNISEYDANMRPWRLWGQL